MTHRMQTTALDRITELLAEHGFDGLAEAVTVLLDEVMKIEPAHAPGAGTYERPEDHQGYANGFEPRTVNTRLGPLTVEVPQARGMEFDPSTPEKGVRSERTLKLAMAETYVQGVPTRKVAAITEQICGPEVTGSQAGRAARLDDELERLRGRPIGETPSLILDARQEHVRHCGQVRSRSALVALGIKKAGRRSFLGVGVSLSEAEAHR